MIRSPFVLGLCFFVIVGGTVVGQQSRWARYENPARWARNPARGSAVSQRDSGAASRGSSRSGKVRPLPTPYRLAQADTPHDLRIDDSLPSLSAPAQSQQEERPSQPGPVPAEPATGPAATLGVEPFPIISTGPDTDEIPPPRTGTIEAQEAARRRSSRQTAQPLTLGQILNDEDQYDWYCEAEFCRRMWACAGGRNRGWFHRCQQDLCQAFDDGMAFLGCGCGPSNLRGRQDFQYPERDDAFRPYGDYPFAAGPGASVGVYGPWPGPSLPGAQDGQVTLGPWGNDPGPWPPRNVPW